jgi:hypothetical protein
MLDAPWTFSALFFDLIFGCSPIDGSTWQFWWLAIGRGGGAALIELLVCLEPHVPIVMEYIRQIRHNRVVF